MAADTDILVLTLYPLSAGYRSLLEGRLGPGLSYRLVSDLRHGGVRNLLRHLLGSHWRRVIVPYEVLEAVSVLSAVQLLAVAHKFPRVEVCDPEGNFRRINYYDIATGFGGLVLASLHGAWARFRCNRSAREYLRKPRPRLAVTEGMQRVLYMKNNLWFGLRAGGSVGHVSGVINAFVELGHSVRFVSPESPRCLSPAVQTRVVPVFSHFAVPPMVNWFRLHGYAVSTALKTAREFNPTVVYQRLSLGDWSGVEVADALNVPLVVEYNGSELWIAQNWGRKGGVTTGLAAAEKAMFKRADLVFTVSRLLCDELLARGVERSRVAWYPNCVDATVYDPAVVADGDRTRARGDLRAEPGDFVFLFLGTFGVWHGAEVFARAAALLSRDADWMRRNKVRFAFVGDGKTRPQCEEIIRQEPSATARTVFTGLVPQHEAPLYLAAADAFVSPHVPNEDGSKFFGSPTKLFEYMAMQRPIVASALGQIGEVLEHERTALLVQPGDVEALAAGLRRIVEDRVLGARLAAAARAEVVAKYTWPKHVGIMLDALTRACAAAGGKPER